MKRPCVYILSNKRNGTLYIGVTGDLSRRIFEHKNDVIGGFTRKYRVHLLVYAEPHETMEAAMMREKQMKKWRRSWKIALIERDNPAWEDLHERIDL